MVERRRESIGSMFGVYTGILRPEDQVVCRNIHRELRQSPTLQIFGLHRVTQLEILETEEVPLLYIAVRSQSIERVTGTRVLRTRYGSHVAILTPAPVYRSHLVVVRTHHFSIHTRHVHDFVTHAEVEVRFQRPLAVAEVDTETTIELRVRRTEINDIQFVDLSVVVHVFVDHHLRNDSSYHRS